MLLNLLSLFCGNLVIERIKVGLRKIRDMHNTFFKIAFNFNLCAERIDKLLLNILDRKLRIIRIRLFCLLGRRFFLPAPKETAP